MDQLRKISLIGLAFLLLSITITGISSGQNEIPDEVTWFFWPRRSCLCGGCNILVCNMDSCCYMGI
jgi:hypothetical protein